MLSITIRDLHKFHSVWSIPNMTLPDRIIAARKGAGFTQSELGVRIGVTQPAISEWEKSARNQPSIDTLRRIAEVTGKPLVWLALGEEFEFTPDEINLIRDFRQCSDQGKTAAIAVIQSNIQHLQSETRLQGA